ncbi:AAA family ATPase [Nocardioides ginkgobilobae]
MSSGADAASSAAAGELLVVIGPPAVGKMTVGRAIAAASDFRLFHNHHVIEPLAEVFGFDHPSFEKLKEAWRREVVEEAAASGMRLVVTFVWPVDLPEDADYVRRLVAPYAARGLRVSFLELHARFETRLVRNVGEDRIAAKPSKADLAWSDAHVRDVEERHRMNTDPDRPSPADAVIAEHRHLRLDNTDLSPGQVAARTLEWLAG